MAALDTAASAAPLARLQFGHGDAFLTATAVVAATGDEVKHFGDARHFLARILGHISQRGEFVSARATQSPFQMPDIRLICQRLDVQFLLLIRRQPVTAGRPVALKCASAAMRRRSVKTADSRE